MISSVHIRTVRETTFFRTVVFSALLLSNLYLYAHAQSIERSALFAGCVILGIYSIGALLIAWLEELLHIRIEFPFAKYILMCSDLVLVTALGTAVSWTVNGGWSLMGNEFYFTYILLLISTMLRNDPWFSMFTAVLGFLLYSGAGFLAAFLGEGSLLFPWNSFVLNLGGLFVSGMIMFWTTRYVSDTQAAADESRSLFEGVAQNIPGIIFQLEVKPGFKEVTPRFISESAFTIFGVNKQDTGRLARLSALIFKDNEKKLHELAKEALAGEQPVSFEFLLSPKGSERWFRGVISPFLQHQDMNLVNGLLLDIDEYKKSQAELEKAKEEAESANRVKADFLATMSHELRTPLNGVIGMVDLLLDSSLNAEQSEYSETIRSSAESLLFIINDVLDFAKLEAGKLRIESRSFDLFNMLQVITETFHVQARAKGLCLYLDYDPVIPGFLIGDDNRIKQVLYNLVSNAVKFTTEGWVIIKARQAGRSEGSVSVNFCIEDTGIGIPPTQINRIFSKFTQADSSITRKYGGTGLGLSISRELVSLLGGDLQVTSAEGRGSSFDFTLTMVLDTGRKEQHPPDLGGMNITLIDSDYGRREAVRKFLEHYHACVRTEGQPGFIDTETDGIVISDGNPVSLCTALEAGTDRENLVRCSLVCAPDADKRASVIHSITADWILLSAPLDYRKLLSALCGGVQSGFPACDEAPVEDASARVLLAEDNPVNRRVLSKMLTKFGCTVDYAENGLKAIELCDPRVHQLVFMDCQMPELDGLEAVKRLRSRGIDLPVIAITGHALPGDRDRFLAAGMNDYVSKPVKANDILQVLRKWAPSADRDADHNRHAYLQEAAGAVFDPESAGKAIGGGVEDIVEIVSLFLSDNPPRVKAFLRDWKKLPRSECSRFFHRINGAASALHAHTFREQCEKLELGCTDMDETELSAEIHRWAAGFDELVTDLRRWLREKSAVQSP
ncbi:MAG: response regulator [Spirochaetales bacterium]|nr:response regulator [Spirochaetales bacterium]